MFLILATANVKIYLKFGTYLAICSDPKNDPPGELKSGRASIK